MKSSVLINQIGIILTESNGSQLEVILVVGSGGAIDN